MADVFQVNQLLLIGVFQLHLTRDLEMEYVIALKAHDFVINAHQGLSIQELAELLQVDHSTMSRNVKKLMQADLVETFQDDADKRRKMIALSAVGRQVLDEATESINLTISNALQSLDEDEIENVITNLRKYSKALEGVR